MVAAGEAGEVAETGLHPDHTYARNNAATFNETLVHLMLTGAFVFFSAWATLLGTPVLSVVCSRNMTDWQPTIQRRAFRWLVGTVAGVVAAAVLGISTSFFEVNVIVACIAYAAFGILAVSMFRVRPRLVGVAAGMFLSVPLLLGLLLGTVGFLGLGFIMGDVPPIYIGQTGSQARCYVYSFGNATTAEGGYDVTLTRSMPLVRFVERSVHKERFTEPSFQPSEACERALHSANY